MKVLTYNIWSLPLGNFLSPYNNFRQEEIARHLNQSDYDIIFIQESWNNSNFFDQTKFHKVDLNHLNKSGLLILSKFQVKESKSIPFKKSGSYNPLFWLLEAPGITRKGFLHTIIEHPDLGDVHLINTHLVAAYFNGPTFGDQRKTQLLEISNYLKSFSKDPIIIGGDLNCGPENMLDGPHSQTKIDNFSPFSKCMNDFDILNESKYFESYQRRNKLPGGKIDHIFYSKHFHFISNNIAMNDKYTVNNKNKIYLSDHFGMETVLKIGQ